MIRELKYEYGILMNPTHKEYGYVTFRLRNDEPKLFVLGELNLGTNEYVLECIFDMHKVMRGELVKTDVARTDDNEPIYKDLDCASISSGEGCTVILFKDRCIVHNLYDDTETEVDPQSFYRMMCDWEKAIHRWENERIEMMIEEKRKPYFKEYLMPMNLDYLEMMLKREIEITKEEAEKHKVSEEVLRKKLKTEVLEKIVEVEKNKNNMSYSKWIIEKEKLVDEYLGINEKMKNSNLETKSTKRTFLQKLFKR